jgi:hypothetical protein
VSDRALISEPAYLRFRERLEDVTRLEALDFSWWVKRHEQQLRDGFWKSGETNAQVYCKMQYVKFLRGQLL